MKLQIAFDMTDLDKALEIGYQVAPHADILEIGTLLIYQHGSIVIKKFKDAFSKNIIFVDSKIVDRAKNSTEIMHKAGADWLSVMAGTSNNVIHNVCTAAHEYKQKVVLDLLDSSALGQSAMEAKSMGVDILMLHQASDELDPIQLTDAWDMVQGNTDLPIYVSAKINRDNIENVIKLQPHGIIIGRSITSAQNPAAEAEFYRGLCDKA